MFFVNSDLKKATEQKSLGDVVNDDRVKVAYGVLSLQRYIDMVKNIGGNDKIFIPKVQRGLVWMPKDGKDPKKTFIQNCITGVNNVIEPMPNIFLFYDVSTKEIQLFDGLQRTSAFLEYEDLIRDGNYDVMIPAALFKGSRPEAENLFRHINDKGIKLNDFEKLASKGGAFELDETMFNKEFRREFNEFVLETTKEYKNIGLFVTKSEKTTLYELLMYTIYKFSNTEKAKMIFPRKKYDKRLVFEWGFQLAYSTTVSNGEKKKYSNKLMMDNLLENFAIKIEYKDYNFSLNKLNEYIDLMNDSISETEAAIRDIYQRNIISNNKEYICKSALKSNSLVGAIVILAFNKKAKIDSEKVRLWFLLQLISERASSRTNHIADDLLISYDSHSIDDLNLKTKQKVITKLEDNANQEKSYVSWLWVLFYLQYNQIKEYSLSKKLEIDHINSQSTLKKLQIDKERINNPYNLAIIPKKMNRTKLNKSLYDFILNDYKDKMENIREILLKIIAYSNEKWFKNMLDSSKKISECLIDNNTKYASDYYQTFLNERSEVVKLYLDKIK